MGNPSPGVTPGELSQDGATRIFGVIRVLSDNRLLVKVFATFKKLLLSLFEDENHLNMADLNNDKTIRPSLALIFKNRVHKKSCMITLRVYEKIDNLLIIEFFLAMFSAETVVDIESTKKKSKSIFSIIRVLKRTLALVICKDKSASNRLFLLVLFFRAMSSAEEVLRCSMRKFGMLKGATYILSVLCWCRKLRYRSGLDNDRLSKVN